MSQVAAHYAIPAEAPGDGRRDQLLPCCRFADACQNLFGGGQIRERFADPPPALAPINIHEQSGIQRDVLSLHASARV